MKRTALTLVIVIAAALGGACSRSRASAPAATQAENSPESPAAQDSAASDAAAKPASDHACGEAPGWRYERIELPPEFAPALPAGVETLYFAPGMFEPGSDSYFSYVFRLAFTTAQPHDAEALRTLLDIYYQGLVGAVASARKLEGIDVSTIHAQVERHGDRFRATVPIVDAFVTAKPVMLYMDVRVQATCLMAAVSPASPGAAIWQDLERALACVPCPAS